MSLVAWYPFNGNYNNNGVGDADLTVTTSPSYISNGKIGKALSSGGFKWTATQTNSIFNKDEMSFAFWVYPVNTPSDSAKYANIIFGTSGMTAPNNRRYSIFLYPTCNDLHLSWQNSDSNGTFIGSVDYGVFPTGKWTHCCITYKNPTATVYINGNLLNTKIGTQTSTNFSNETQVITSDTNRYINDFRVYNHCLSAKEVKELSKGLISHYPLNDPYIETTTNLITSNKYYTSSSTGWGAHRAVITDFDCTNEPVPSNVCSKMDVTYDTSLGSGGGFGITVGCGNVRVSPNTTYCYSVYVKASDNLAYTNANFLYRYERSDSAAVMEGGIATNNKREHVGNGWYRYYNTFTTNANTTNINFMFFSYPGKNVTYYVCCPQVEVKDHLTPYVLGARTGDFAYDCSGYRNDLTVYSTIKMESPSPRGTCCCNFNQSGFLYNDSIPVTTTQYTIAMWVKIPSSINAQHFLYGTFDSWTGNGVGAWRDTGGTSYSWIMRSDAESSHGSLGTGTLATDVWCHIAWVWNGTTILFYKNGVLVNSVTYGKGGSCVHKNIVLGNSNYNGRPISETDQSFMSDFRFYSTALSASDIKELYDTPITITQNGVLMTQGEFVEE